MLGHFLSQQLHDRSVEQHRHGVLVLQHDPGQPCRPPPRFTRAVDVPRTGHPHVAVEHETVVEMNQKVLSVGQNVGDGRPDQTLELIRGRVRESFAG